MNALPIRWEVVGAVSTTIAGSEQLLPEETSVDNKDNFPVCTSTVKIFVFTNRYRVKFLDKLSHIQWNQ